MPGNQPYQLCHTPAANAPGRRSAHGFTLVELMITLAIAAVLIMIAVPSFKHVILSNKLSTAANALSNSIKLARLDAIKLNATTQFCGSGSNGGDTLGTACAAASAGPSAVYSLPQSGTPGAAGTVAVVHAANPSIAGSIQYNSAGVTPVRFSGQGFGYAPTGSANAPYSGDIAIICTSQLSSDNQRVISMTTGSIVATATSTGTCP